MDILNRCQLGVRVPDELRPKIQEAQMALRRRAPTDDARWLPANDWILTVMSLGELRPQEIVRVQQLAGGVIAQTPRILRGKLDGITGSPNTTMPKMGYIPWVGEEAVVKILQDALRQSIGGPPASEAPMGIEIVRVRTGGDKGRGELGRGIKVLHYGEVGDWNLTGLELLRSDASGAGVSWQPLAWYPFGG